MAEVEQVTREYLPLAQACSSIFFVLGDLHLLHHFYQFSLRFFLDIFDFVLLHNPSLAGITDSRARLAILVDDLFLHVFKRTSRALLHSDHLTLAMLLAQVKLGGSHAALDEAELNFFLEGGESIAHEVSSELSILDPAQQGRLQAFSRLPSFKIVTQHIVENAGEWKEFLHSKSPELSIPQLWQDLSREFIARSNLAPADLDSAATALALRKMLIIKCFRSDRLLQSVGGFIGSTFGKDLLAESPYELGSMVANEVAASSPVCLASVPGHDAAYRVDSLVSATNSKCTSVAMGSLEGFALADQAIAAAARTGSWVLLKNVHLAPAWLSQLEKRLQSLNPNPAFRLFLTMETNPSIPVNILRQGRVLMNEPPPGIRANMLESLRSITPARLASGPAEKTRLYFLLAWFHAVVQERLRYVPLGWSKAYEFNDSDQDAALDTIDSWLASAAKGKSNVDPAAIPWDAIRSLMRESIYGGKIDTEFDQILLDSFVAKLFSPRAYDVGFQLVQPGDGERGLQMPDATRLDQFIAWTVKLPEQEPPSYLSLPPTAERVIAIAQGSFPLFFLPFVADSPITGTALLSRLLKMRSLDDNETVAQDVIKGGAALEQPAWMRSLGTSCEEWLKVLPEVRTISSTLSSCTDSSSRSGSPTAAD